MAAAAVKSSPPPMQPPQKSRPDRPPRDSSAERAGRPAGWIRVLVSLLLIWHLAAVVLAPMSIPPSSRFVVDVAQGPFMQWYLDLLYLNHGYHFFAPDPGAGRLIRYEVLDEQGGLKKQGEFPNSDVHWPRLYYHRYFMLADQVGLGMQDKQWQRKYLEAYARQLLRESDGQSIRLRWVIHYSLPPLLAEQGRTLTDPESYETVMEVTQRRSDIAPPAESQSGAWQSGRVESIGRRPAGGYWTGGVR